MPVDRPFRPPSAARQIQFYQLLVAARKTWLHDALSEALLNAEPRLLKQQITQFVPADAQRILAGAGVRDEAVFPTPVVLQTKPTLVGYYRLLLGSPQKSFYHPSTGLAVFKGMETRGILGETQKSLLPGFCESMSLSLAQLVRQASPALTPRDVAELPLLAFGSYLQGQNNVAIGKRAMRDVFLAISSLLDAFIVERTDARLVLRNASGRTVNLTLASDPDLRIEERFGETWVGKVAVEVKGGTDASNFHNRAGEAEKSHQKARSAEFRDFWTIIATTGIDMSKARRGSPTTTSWFDVGQLLNREGPDWESFKNQLASAVGVPLAAAGTAPSGRRRIPR